MSKTKKFMTIATSIIVPLLVAIIAIAPSMLDKINITQENSIEQLAGVYVCTGRIVTTVDGNKEINRSPDNLFKLVITRDRTMYLYLNGVMLNCVWSIVIKEDIIECYPVAGSSEFSICKQRDSIDYNLEGDTFYWITKTKLESSEEWDENIEKVKYEFTKVE